MVDTAEKPPGRPMKYPYTFSAKLAQFPWKFYYNNQWIFRYWGLSVILCLPVFNSIRKLSKCKNLKFQLLLMSISLFSANSPENVAKWAEIRRKEREMHH